MDRNRYKRIAVCAGSGVGLLLMLVALLFYSEFRRTQHEKEALLSDLFDAGLQNAHDLGSGRGFQIIIMREAQSPGTGPGHETRPRWRLLFDENLRFPQASLVTRSSFLLTNAVPTDLRAKLRLPKGVESVVLSHSELDHMTRSDFNQRFHGNHNLDIFSISQPGFNFSKTEAILYSDHYCAGLCGGGGYILARKVDGVWRILDQHNTWVS